MTELDLKTRTKQFALRIMKLVDALPESRSTRHIASQLVRSGMSVGANYRAACRGRSKAEFVAKLGTVEEETDESMYWMELIVESDLMPQSKIVNLYREADEILRIIVRSRKTASVAIRKSKITNQKSVEQE